MERITKICNRCGIEKTLEQFHKDSHGFLERRKDCKDCRKKGNPIILITPKMIGEEKRQEAIRNKEQYYFTGFACSRGHIAKRTTIGRQCIECSSVIGRKWNQNNKGKNIERARKWRSNNIEKARKAVREYDKSERGKQVRDAWSKNNTEKIKSYVRNRTARIHNANGKHTAQDIEKLFIKQKGKCMNCFKSIKNKYDVDHIIPLSKGGNNWPSNLQILCPSCNRSKGAKDPYHWAQENGRLF